MPDQTHNEGLPYPVGSDRPDIPRDMLALASRLDDLETNQDQLIQAAGAALVALGTARTTLPSAPTDGQIVSLSIGPNLRWQVVWDQISGAWLDAGGGWLFARIEADGVKNANNGWTDPDTGGSGPVVAAPYSGAYYCWHGARIAAAADNTLAGQSISIGGGGATDDRAALHNSATRSHVSTMFLASGVTAGDNFTAKYQNGHSSPAVTIGNRFVAIKPYRITG